MRDGLRRPLPLQRRKNHWRMVREALLSLSLALFLLLSLSLLWLSYQRFQAQAFMPLKRLYLTAPLRHGEESALLEIVRHHRAFDLIKLNVNEIAEEMESLPWIERVDIRKKWPDALMISVQERRPLFRWGEEDYLDGHGKRFRGAQAPEYQNLPQVLAMPGQEKRILAYAQILYPWLREQGLPVQLISLDAQQSWHVFLGDVDMILGRDHLHERLKKMVHVYHEVVKPHQHHIKKVDLRYQKHEFSVVLKEGAEIKTIQQEMKKNRGQR